MVRLTGRLWAVGVTVSAHFAAPAAAQTVTDLDVQPRDITIGVGERKEVLASAFDRSGNIVSVTFRWASTNPAVVRVEEDASVPGIAYLIGMGPGVASVDVTAGGQQRTVTVQVSGGVVAGPRGTGTATVLQIEPTAVFLFPGEDLQLRLIFLKNDGSPAEATAVNWRSFRSEIATIDQFGRVVGISPGQGLIEASTPAGLQRRVQVSVSTGGWGFADPILSLSPGTSDSVRVVVPQQSNRPVAPSGLTWRSTNPNIVTVSPFGVATGISAGRAELIVNGFGQESRLAVSVHREVEFLVSSPPGDTLIVPIGGQVTVSARAEAADETPVPDAPIIWTVSDTSIARYLVSESAVIGRRIGHASLTVRAPGDLQKTWTLSVVAAGLVVNLRRAGLAVGETTTVSASFADSAGRPLAPASGVGWTSSDPSVARVDQNGTVTATGFGYTAVVANTPWGVADTVRVYVQGEILVTSTRSGSPDIYAFDRSDPGRLNRITQEPSQELSGVYSPDGSRIAFVTDRNANFEIYVANADGSDAQRLTTSAASEAAPAWTPDGRRIVYTSDAAGNSQIWIMDVDGSNQRQLTSGEAANLQPSVSPDGRTIAFTSVRDGNYDVYFMSLDGSNQRNFTSSPTNEVLPVWSGDSAVVFVREQREGREIRRVVTRMNLARATTDLTQANLQISDFAISSAGDLLAAVIGLPGPSGELVQRLFLIPLGGSGTPSEVPRALETEQIVLPAFRP